MGMTLFIVLASCHPAPSPLSPAQVMNLELQDQTGAPLASAGAPADNYTYAVIVDTLVDKSVLDTSTAVTFTTDNGAFSTGGTSCAAKFDQTGKAYAYIRNKWATSAHVEASVGTNFTLYITVPFQTAWPDSIYLQFAGAVSDSFGSMVTFTTRLIRPLGTPTAGLQLGFYARDTVGNPVASAFNNITPSDTTGSVTAEFWPLVLNYKGFLMVTAFLVTAPGDTIKGQNRVLLH